MTTPTYDPGTDVGLVRLLIPDTDVDNPDACCFDDDEIAAFIGLARDEHPMLAAAIALEVLASNEALVSKKVQTRDGQQTDGPAVAASLLARAALLRKSWADDDTRDDDEDWAIAELVVDDFSYRQRIVNDWLRGPAAAALGAD